jgi:hypothetical protein
LNLFKVFSSSKNFEVPTTFLFYIDQVKTIIYSVSDKEMQP